MLSPLTFGAGGPPLRKPPADIRARKAYISPNVKEGMEFREPSNLPHLALRRNSLLL